MTQRRYMPINGELTDAMKGQDTTITGDWTFDAGAGDSSLTIESSTGDAALYIKADTDNNNENDNPFIRFEQDANQAQMIVGLTGDADKDAQGNTFTGCSANAASIHQLFSGGTVALGIGGSVGMKISSGNVANFYSNVKLDSGNGEALTLKGGSTGSSMNSWIQWDESDDSRAGFIGYGSSGNTQLFLWNDIGDLFLQAGSGNPGQFKIFEDVNVADDATATWSSPSSTAHGIWIIKNSWDDSGDGMFAHTAQSVTSWAGGSNFQLGDNGTNPNVDGDINAYMSNNYTLSVKNRTGGTRRIVVFYFGGG